MYFEVHQPWRLRRFSILHPDPTHHYFDDDKNAQILRKVAEKCYLPANRTMLELIERYQGKFRISYSITGVALEQMRAFAPEVLQSFQDLAKTGCVEFIAETYHHTLAAVYDEAEFQSQVFAHNALMAELFDAKPRVFRNTELIYSDRIGQLAADMGYIGVIAEGVDDILQWRSPNYLYEVAGRPQTALLLKNYRLSDDVAFRFSNRGWADFPLTSDKFASWVHQVNGNGDTVNLFMDYETFGEHQWADTGIFDFLRHLPEAIFRDSNWSFATPSEVITSTEKRAELSFHRITSWADVDRDLTAWQGNEMQQRALHEAFGLRDVVLKHGDPGITAAWRQILTSDHFYYMCTKWFADGDVHAYFSPYESPYEAFMNYMNVLNDLRVVLGLEPLRR